MTSRFFLPGSNLLVQDQCQILMDSLIYLVPAMYCIGKNNTRRLTGILFWFEQYPIAYLSMGTSKVLLMIKRFLLSLLVFSSLGLTPMGARLWNGKLTSYVDPFIGTAGGGNTHPGAVLPWGMASSSPLTIYGPYGDQKKFVKQGAVAYENGKKFLAGFTHVNLSGVGCPDLGNVVLMPTSGELDIDPKKYGSPLQQEVARPGYYSATLAKYGIRSEVSATTRTVRHRHSFPEGQANFILNLGLGATDERGGMLNLVSDSEIEGFDMFGQFCFEKHYNGRVFFVIQFSKPATEYGTWHDDYRQTGHKKSAIGDQVGAFYTFQAQENESIEVRVGISYVSIENARKNLQEEQQATAFEDIKDSAARAWEKELGRIRVEGGSEEEKINFYTALYHILIHPNIFNDVNGQYRAMDGTVRNAGERNRYSVFSLWDTYRNLHPFLSLVYPKKQEDMVVSILDMYKETGWLPKWELSSKETYVMVGDPAAIVIADSYLRGIKGFDPKTALKAMLKSARDTTQENLVRPGLKHYLDYAYIPHEFSGPTPAVRKIPWGSVSTTLEYALADWNIAQFARALGEKDIASEFEKRSGYYKNLFHNRNSFILPKKADGTWQPLPPGADPGVSELGFVEGNAWNYNFFVPHDINGLGNLMGKKQMLGKLQHCFDADQFVLWNEPDMAYPYLFNYFKGEEWRTQKEVYKAIKKHFNNSPAGLPGNDDCGTISCWLLMSMMGFYPDLPGKPHYALGLPTFDKVIIQLDNAYYPGSQIVIEKSPSVTKKGRVNRISWNGKPHTSYFIMHDKFVQGGTLRLE